MGYISKDTLTLDAVLTQKGRDYLKLAMFGEDLLLLRLTKVFVFKLR